MTKRTKRSSSYVDNDEYIIKHQFSTHNMQTRVPKSTDEKYEKCLVSSFIANALSICVSSR